VWVGPRITSRSNSLSAGVAPNSIPESITAGPPGVYSFAPTVSFPGCGIVKVGGREGRVKDGGEPVLNTISGACVMEGEGACGSENSKVSWGGRLSVDEFWGCWPSLMVSAVVLSTAEETVASELERLTGFLPQGEA
jgi:hypothetical protein